MKQISNSKAQDSGGKMIFENPVLCSQLLRDYSGLDILKDVSADDIEDVTERFLPMFTEERDADVVKKVRLKTGEEMFMISLIDHKSSVDYNVSMQLLRYMVFIWEDYEKRMEAEHPGISKTKVFRYPPILPIVYYEGQDKWTAPLGFGERVFLQDVFAEYIPQYSYRLIELNRYTNEQITEAYDELSIVMLVNKLKKAADFEAMELPEGYLEEIAKDAPQSVLDVIARVVAVLLRRIEVPEPEVGAFTDRIKERKMGQLFEDFDVESVLAPRRAAREEGRAEGSEHRLVDLICKKLRKGKSVEQIADEVEEDVIRVQMICDVAAPFEPEYDTEKVFGDVQKKLVK